MWVSGNAYFNGAKSWKQETDKYTLDTPKAYVTLIEKDGSYTIETNVYNLLDGWSTGIINSDVLGKAFEPEQRFENPDGSTIVFNRDFCGNLRSLNAIPGPFANAAAVIDL